MLDLNITNQCRNCVHFKDDPLPAKDSVCSELGVQPFAVAPRCFSTQPLVFVRSKLNISALGKELRHLNHSQMVTLANHLAHAAELLNFGLKFGQTVYFNMSQNAYLENYFKGYVVGVREYSDKQGKITHILIASNLELSESEEGGYKERALLKLPSDSILSKKEYEAKAAELKAAGLIEEPIDDKRPRRRTYAQWLKQGRPLEVSPDYEYTPPTVDADLDLVEAWSDLDVADGIQLELDFNDTLSEESKPEESKLKYDEYIDEEGNKVRTLSGTASYREQPKFLGTALEDTVLRA